MDRYEISTLRVYYGKLLTSRQNEMIAMHYDEDMSFGEIAEVCGVSRSAVLDGINKGVKHLVEFEESLCLVARDIQINKLLDRAHSLCENDDAKETIAKIKRILEE